jgi:hypothetical protein
MRRFLALIAALITTACFNPAAPDAVTGTPFELKAGASATLPDGARITFDRVHTDSRCPIDAICVSAGGATVAISLARSGRPAEAREIHTESARSQISYANYVIRLTELQPYPRSDRQTRPEDYVATFIVQTP